jgi:hypothetical protein
MATVWATNRGGERFEINHPCRHITQLHIYCPKHPLWEALRYEMPTDMYRCTANGCDQILTATEVWDALREAPK